MKSKIFVLSLLALTLILTGCGKTANNQPTVGDVANTYGAAQQISQDMNDPNKISSDENVENIYTIMNYTGKETKENMKAAIKQGIEDGKKQGDLSRETVITPELGAGYLLGYIFGCKAVTSDEDKCNTDMGAKYQTIITEELQKQSQGAMPTAQ
jgi:hypothetical protein